jgi:hypothetical protein
MTESPDPRGEKYLRESELWAVDLEELPFHKSALRNLGHASAFRPMFPPSDIERGLRLIDEVIRWDHDLTLDDVSQLEGRCSNLGDACGARLVAHMTIPSDAFASEHWLAKDIGPLTLQALLRAGADPNRACEGHVPLDGVMNSPFRDCPDHRLRMAAMLVAAGADPEGVHVPEELRDSFRQLCDLRALSAFCAGVERMGTCTPASRFVARDGDSAVAHRVRAFLVPRDFLVPQ